MEMLAMMEKEFISSISDISHKAEMMQISTNERQAGAIEESKEQLEEAEDLFKQMELEVQPMKSTEKTSYQAKLRKYKADLEEAKRKVNKMEFEAKQRMNKETVMGVNYDIETNDHNQNQHLLNAQNNHMNGQNNKLKDAVMFAEQAELDARDIKVNLDRNARSLQNANDNVHRINGELTKGSRLIDTMRRHEMKNRIILYCVIAILILAALVIGYVVLR